MQPVWILPISLDMDAAEICADGYYRLEILFGAEKPEGTLGEIFLCSQKPIIKSRGDHILVIYIVQFIHLKKGKIIK